MTVLLSGSGSLAMFSGVANFSDTMAHDANKETTIADTTVSFIVFFIFWVGLFFIDMIFAFLTALSRYYEFQNDKSMSRQVGFLIQNSILGMKNFI
jgi:hypothetical protein